MSEAVPAARPKSTGEPVPYIATINGIEPDETYPVIEGAGEQRYLDGLSLALEPGREAGAIYALGYVAEVVLKAAYCRARGVSAATPMRGATGAIQMAKTDVARFRNRGYRVSDIRTGHELEAWFELLSAVRHFKGAPLSTAVSVDARAHLVTLQDNWSVDSRYHSCPAGRPDALAVFEAADWYWSNRRALWR